MDSKLLKSTARTSVLLMVCMIIFSVYVTNEKKPDVVLAGTDEILEEIPSADFYAQTDENTAEESEPDEAIPEPVNREEEMKALMGSRYLIIPKNELSADSQLTVTEDYVYRTITIKSDNVTALKWDNTCVRRVNEGIEYFGEADAEHLEVYMDEYLYEDDPAEIDDIDAEDYESGDSEQEIVAPESMDIVQAISVTYDAEASTAQMSITTDHLYIPTVLEDDCNYYIDLKFPKEVYNKIVVVDAGHGGKHPGTMSTDRRYLEKNFNLQIVEALKERFDAQDDITVFYTRNDDSSVYLRPRVNLANETDADFFISIHNNAYYNKYAYGTEVLYNELLETDGPVNSKRLAALLLEEVNGRLNNRNRGLRMGSTTYIIGHSEVPVALMEVGYLTNPDDLNMLLDKQNIELIADGLYSAIVRAYEEKGE